MEDLDSPINESEESPKIVSEKKEIMFDNNEKIDFSQPINKNVEINFNRNNYPEIFLGA